MKTVFQKAVSLILSLAVLLGTTPLMGMAASAAENGGVTAYYCDSGLFKDSNYTTEADNAFRSTITGVEVREDTQMIGGSAFESCKELTAVAIPDSVTTIGNRAFYQCAKLKSVIFGKNSQLNLIGEYAFFQCAALTAIVIPDGVTAIGNEAFQLCGIKSITFGEGSKLKSIGESAFECCGNLTEIRIPDSVTTIGNHALQQCTNLKSVTFGEGSKLQSIGEFAFLSDENLTDFEIPQSVTEIGREAFFFCSSLTRIEIPHGVTTLGADFDDQTFGACTGLTCVTVSDSLPAHADTFNGCTSLSNLYVIGSQKPSAMREVTNVFFFSENPDGTYKLENYSGTGAGRVIPTELYGKEINPPIQEADLHTQEVIAYCDGAKIYKNQDKTGEIGPGDPYRFMISKVEFTGADIQTITAPGSYEGAFLNCTGLTEITVPASVTQIGTNSFRDCTGLKNIAFENGSKLQSIGSQAFDGCVKLSGIDLPGGVTSIDMYAFNGCVKLSGIDLPGGITGISSNTFNNCTSLTDIAIPDNVTKIENMAFNGCTSLKSVTFGKDSKLQSIGSSTFWGCTGLTGIVIPKSVTTFGSGVFFGCASLNKIAVEPGNTVLYTDNSGVLFYTDPTAGKTLLRCPAGKSGTYEIPDGIVRMDEGAFSGCTGLTGVTIPASIQSIPPYAFDGCTVLNLVKFGGSAVINEWVSSCAFDTGKNTLMFIVPKGKKDYYKGCLIGTVMGGTTPEIKEEMHITAFVPLPARTVPVGTAQTELNLPDSLSATADGTEHSAVDGVTWTSSPAYDKDTVGTYTFTAALPPWVTLESGLASPEITVRVAETGKAITAFSIGKYAGVLDEAAHTVTVSVPFGTDVTALTPTIAVSKNAGVSPASGAARNFTKPVVYTVTAENGETQTYTVTVAVSKDTRETGKTITAFSFGKYAGVLDEAARTVTVKVPYGTDVTAFTPTIAVSKNAGVSPASGAARNFTNPIVYTVTAENGETQTYTVTVNIMEEEAGNSSNTEAAVPALPVSVTDMATGVTADLTGAEFPAGVTGVTLSAQQEHNSAADPQTANVLRLAVSDAGLNVIGTPSVYNLKLLDRSGNVISGFNGKVTVKIPLPAGLRGVPHVFRYEESTGALTDMNAVAEDGFLVFSTEHFSHYAVAGVGDSITLDTTSYAMPFKGSYQIGMKLTGAKAASVQFHSTNDRTAAVTKLKNGNYQVTGKDSGTAYIMFDVYDNKNRLLTHASVRIDVKTGIRPRGDSARQTGMF